MRNDRSQPNEESLKGVAIGYFRGPREWERWLAKNHAASSGLWLKIAKRAAGAESVSYAEALEIALCYGWIDSQKGRYDEGYFLQKFTPRRSRSVWSKPNREKALALIESGRMKPAGLQAVDDARRSGRWETAYDSASVAAVPADLQAELDRNPAAQAFFAALSGANRYAILFRLQTARKAETREKRLAEYLRMLKNGETIHPQ